VRQSQEAPEAPDDRLFRSLVESVTPENEFIVLVSPDLDSPLTAIFYKKIRNLAHISALPFFLRLDQELLKPFAELADGGIALAR
jgi:hypothetical protein